MLHGLHGFLQKKFQAFLSLLTFLSFRSILIIWFHVFLGRSLRKLLVTLKVLHLDQALSSILSTWPNNYSGLSFKQFHILFNFSLATSFSVEIQSLGLTLHIHLTILASTLSSLTTCSSLTGQVLISIMHNATCTCII